MSFWMHVLSAGVALGALCAQAGRTYVAGYSAVEPALDGKAEKAVWDGAKWSEPFRSTVAGPSVRTRYKALYTREALYFYVECAEPDMAAIASEERPHEYWLCDVVELFLSAVKGERLHLVVSARGNANNEISGRTLVRTGNYSDWGACTVRDKASWSCEFRVPYHFLGAASDASAIEIPFEISRNRPSRKEVLTWAGQSGAAQGEAGLLVLEKAPEAAVAAIRKDLTNTPGVPVSKNKEIRKEILRKLFGEDAE